MTAASPAINEGGHVRYTTDHTGTLITNTPDIGAHEYVDTPITTIPPTTTIPPITTIPPPTTAPPTTAPPTTTAPTTVPTTTAPTTTAPPTTAPPTTTPPTTTPPATTPPTTTPPTTTQPQVATSATSLLPNGDFEAVTQGGNPSGWTRSERFVATTQSLDGALAGCLVADDDSRVVVKTLVSGIERTATYELTGSVFIHPTSDQEFRFKVQVQWRGSAGHIATQTVADWHAETSGWQPFTATITAPAGADRAQVMLHATSLRTTIDVDSFSLVRR